MNKFFRVIWSRTRQCMIVVSETGRAVRGKSGVRRSRRPGAEGAAYRAAAVFAALLGMAVAQQAQAEPAQRTLPQNGRVSAGQATIGKTSPGAMVINQNSKRAIINWDSFNVGRDARVEFKQPSTSSIALNRVQGSSASQINGQLKANGQVWVSNKRGVYFGTGARVDVGGLVATTHSMSDDAFMSGGTRFSRDGAEGSVVNAGHLTASDGGYIALLAPEVRNTGVIVARGGTAALVAGEAMELEFDEGGGLMNVRVEAGDFEALVENGHLIEAPGGQVIMSAGAANAIRSGVVRNSGTVEARGINRSGGRIFLGGGQVQTTATSRLRATTVLQTSLRPVARPSDAQIHMAGSKVTLGGSADVSGQKGGTIAVEATDITLTGTARLTATGQTGGGNVLIGGDWQGGTSVEDRVFARADAMRQAQTVTMAEGARIDASAIGQGDGGRVVLWSDVGDFASVTRVAGEITARGGATGGDGGAIETSGHRLFTAGATGSAAAPNGRAGEWLFDPTDITVTNDATTDGGVAGATVTSGEISRLLNDGTSVTLSADRNLTWAANAEVSVAPPNEVDLTLHSIGTAVAALSFGSGSRIESTDAPLNVTIDMEGNASLSASVDLSGLTAITNGGDFTVWDFDRYGVEAALTLSSTTSISTGAGDISLSGTTYRTGGPSVYVAGVEIGGATLSTTAGDISISGRLLGNGANISGTSRAVKIDGGADISTGTGNIAIDGSVTVGDSDTDYVVDIIGTAKDTQIRSGGTLDITALRTVNRGRALRTGDVALSAVGDVTISASENGTTVNSYTLDGSDISSSGGDVAITVASPTLYVSAPSTITADGDVTLTADRFNSPAPATDTLTVTAGSDLTIEPYGTSFPTAFTLDGSMSGDNFIASGSLAGLIVNDFPSMAGFTLGKVDNLADMTLAGTLSLPGRVAVYGNGMDITGTLTSVGDGDILLRSYSGVNQAFRLQSSAAIVKSNGTGTLTMKGDGRVFSQGSIGTANDGLLNVVLWSDHDNDNNDGGVSSLGTISTGGGHVWMGGSNSVGGTSVWNGLEVGDGPSIGLTGYNGNALDFYGDITTGGGDLLVWAGDGLGTFDGIVTNADGATLSLGDGDATFIADRIYGDSGGHVSLNTTGHLTLAPDGGAYASALNWDHDNNNSDLNLAGAYDFLRVADFDQLTGLTIGQYDGMSGVTISNSSDVTFVDGAELAGPIAVHGDAITIQGDLTTTAANDGILLKAQTDIATNANRTLQTNNGDIVLWAGSSSDGSITLGSGNTLNSANGATGSGLSGGGDIVLGGGASGTDRPDGLATTSAGVGVLIGDNATFRTGGGDLSVRGKSTATGLAITDMLGLRQLGALTIDSGTGAILMEGQAVGLYGLELSGSSDAEVNITSAGTSGDAITLTGSGNELGVVLNYKGQKTIAATGGGGISITGDTAGTNPFYGVFLGDNSNILANSGDISIDGGTYGVLVKPNATLGRKAGSPVTTSSSDIALTGDYLSVESGGAIATSGTAALEPAGASFGGPEAFTPENITFSSDVSGLTLGKPGNTSNITLSDALSIAGPISVYGGDVAFDGAVTASGGTITVTSGGAVTQTAALEAAALLLNGTGTFTLNHTGNDIGTLAGGADASRPGSLSFTNSGALSIGSVSGTDGITASGDILVETLSGDLTLGQDVDTNSSSTTAIRLNAGRTAAAGTDTGGNILISGDPALTTGAGGTTSLMSGSISDSTGLTALVGAGSGNFRYNSDESATNFSTALATDAVNAIYRERPVVSGSVQNESITYGGANPTFVITGGTGAVNGDSGFVIQSAQNSGAGLLQAGTYTVGVGGLTALGYDVASVSQGTLTVGKKAVTVSGLSSQDKTYDGTTTATVNGTAALESAVSPNAGTGSDGRTYAGDTVSLTGTATGTFNSLNVSDATGVGFTGLGITGSDAANYTLMPHADDSSARIIARELTLTASRVYDGTTDLTGDVVIGNLVGGESLTYSGATASDAHVTTPDKHISAITLQDGAGGGLASNYALPTLDATGAPVTLSARTLTPTLTNTGVTKTYDGTTSAPTGFTPVYGLAGLAAGDTSADLTAAGTAYNNVNVADADTLTLSGLVLDAVTGSNGSRASDYVLGAASASVAAMITPAELTVQANNNARFVTQSDAAGYAGVSYSGFVNGETRATASGLVDPGVTRTARGPDGNTGGANSIAGQYTNQLAASGGSADNYSLSYQTGDYTIVPSDQLLITVDSVSNIFGVDAAYQITSVEYFNGASAVRLDDGSVPGSGVSIDADNRVTVNDGAAGTAAFQLAPQNAVFSTSGELAVGSYQLGQTGAVTENSGNFSDTLTVIGAHEVTAKPVTASTAQSPSKVYDGTVGMTGIDLQLSGLLAGDLVGIDSLGSFSDRNAGTNKTYSIEGMELNGADAGNYNLSGGSSLSGSDGVITPRGLTADFTADDKVYDGNRTATATGSSADILTGDEVGITQGSALFSDKNVGTNKTVAIDGFALNGADAGNYALLNDTASATADITRLDSVTWIGGSSGDWFDPANWAGGAVPDLSNVANVVIPDGVDVTFGTTMVPPAEAGPVNVDSIGSDGSLTQTDGELNVGDGGITLDGFTQTGGTTTSTGDILLDRFTQSGGGFVTAGGADLTVAEDFSQSGNGSVTVSGGADITDNSDGVTLGNLIVEGELDVYSSDGAVTQVDGSTITVSGETRLWAEQDGNPADITLDGAANDFGGTVNASGDDIALNDSNGLVLGQVTATGGLTARAGAALELSGEIEADRIELTSVGGDIVQTGGSLTVRSGPSTITAEGAVNLTQPGNSIDGGLTVVSGGQAMLGRAERRGAQEVRRQMAAWEDVAKGFSSLLTDQARPPAISMAAIGLSADRFGAVKAIQIKGSGKGRPAVLAVTIPQDMLTGGTGFSIQLPDDLAQRVAGAESLSDGRPLPDWLKFDPERGALEAENPPEASLPAEVAIGSGANAIRIVITPKGIAKLLTGFDQGISAR